MQIHATDIYGLVGKSIELRRQGGAMVIARLPAAGIRTTSSLHRALAQLARMQHGGMPASVTVARATSALYSWHKDKDFTVLLLGTASSDEEQLGPSILAAKGEVRFCSGLVSGMRTRISHAVAGTNAVGALIELVEKYCSLGPLLPGHKRQLRNALRDAAQSAPGYRVVPEAAWQYLDGMLREHTRARFPAHHREHLLDSPEAAHLLRVRHEAMQLLELDPFKEWIALLSQASDNEEKGVSCCRPYSNDDIPGAPIIAPEPLSDAEREAENAMCNYSRYCDRYPDGGLVDY